MKTLDEIKQMASKNMLTEEGKYGFILGYIRCQRDSQHKKHTDQDIIDIFNRSRICGLTIEYLQSVLDKKD